jgi:hypothetical protein
MTHAPSVAEPGAEVAPDSFALSRKTLPEDFEELVNRLWRDCEGRSSREEKGFTP